MAGGAGKFVILVAVVALLASPSGCSAHSVPLGTLSVAPIALGTLNHFDTLETTMAKLTALPPNTLIDTAELYGDAERILGQAVAELPNLRWGENGLYSASKFGPPLSFGIGLGGDASKLIVSACRKSADRLGVDCIDLYQIHYSDELVQPFAGLLGQRDTNLHLRDEAYWDGLATCYETGLAANVGVCNYGPTMVRRAYEALAQRGVPLVSNQINYNLMRRSNTDAQETKAVCDELGIRILAYHPLGKGILTGKWDLTTNIMPKTGTGKYYRTKRQLQGTVELRRAIAEIAAKRGKTWAQVAIQWLVEAKDKDDTIVIPLVGARTVEQVQENFHGHEHWSLTKEDVQQLDEASYQCIERYAVLGKEFKLE
jgi:pyridoxine 4-dehydrogenase